MPREPCRRHAVEHALDEPVAQGADAGGCLDPLGLGELERQGEPDGAREVLGATAAIAFLCICAGIALGFLLRVALRETITEAKEIVGVGDAGVTGLVVLLAALVLGLLIASATTSFSSRSKLQVA